MTAKQLWDLFFQTGLPEAYILARRKESRDRGRGETVLRGPEGAKRA